VTSSASTVALIPKPSSTPRGKSVAQGVLAIAPTSRTARAENAASTAKDANAASFSDALKDATRTGKRQAERGPAAGHDTRQDQTASDANVRDDAPETRDAVPGKSASDSMTRETSAAPADDAVSEPEPTAQVDSTSPTDAKPATSIASTAASAVSVESVASESVQSAAAQNAAGATSKSVVNKSKAKATDPLGLIPREHAATNESASGASAKNAESANPDARGTAAGDDTIVLQGQASTVASEAQMSTASDTAASVSSRARESEADADASKNDSDATPAKTNDRSDAAHAARESHRDVANTRDAQQATPLARESVGHDATAREGNLAGFDAAATRGGTSNKGDAIKLAVSMAAHGTESTDGAAESLNAQAARGLAAAFKHKGGTVTLNLTPETLGQIKVKITVDDAKVSALIQTSTEQAKRMLEQSGETLRSALESKGLSVDRLQITHVSPTMNELRDVGRSSNDGRQQGDSPQQQTGGDSRSSGGGGSNGGGGQGSFEDQARAWREPRAGGIFDLGELNTELTGVASSVGAPAASPVSAMRSSAGNAFVAPTTRDGARVGVVRLSVDALA